MAARHFVLAYLRDHHCVDCDLDDPTVLEFDHVGPKRRGIASLITSGASAKSLLEEISHCEVVCANCHRRRTAERAGWTTRRAADTSTVGYDAVRRRNRALVRAALRAGCSDCHETDPLVLDFDHIGAKRRNVSAMVRGGYSAEAIEAEIAKCEIRCANCHRRMTSARGGHYRSAAV